MDEILNKNAQAHGGLEKIKSIRSMKITGKISALSAPEVTFTIHKKRPNFVRIDFTDRGKQATLAFDGSTAWETSFLGGEALQASDNEIQEIRQDADFDGPLIDYRDKGETIELAGKEDVNGTAAYKLKVTLNDGSTEYGYLDAAKGLELKRTRKVKQQGKEIDVITSFANYKQAGGLMLPFLIRETKGSVQQQVTIEKVATNTTIEDFVFKMPATSPPPDEIQP